MEIFAKKIPKRAIYAWNKLMVFRFVFNFLFAGLPFCTFGIAAIVFNLYVNIAWNKFWAGGNLWLLFNTVYLWLQFFMAIPLMFEIGFILRWTKPIRFLTLISSLTYNFWYFIGVVEWLSDIFLKSNEKKGKESHPEIDVILQTIVAYNLMIHLSTFMINLFISNQELMIFFFDAVLNLRAPSEDNRMQLAIYDLGHMFNPVYWVKNSKK